VDVRPEIRADERAISEIHRLAFGGDGEAKLVEALRETESYIPALSLVALQGGRVMGHVLFTNVELVPDDDANGGPRPILSLAPLAVHPEVQKQGIGRTLVESGLRRASTRIEPLVVVLGHPEYYPKFGFVPAAQYEIRNPFPTDDSHYMARRMPAYRPAGPATVRYPPEFDAL
jgi:putative acetyltransferase